MLHIVEAYIDGANKAQIEHLAKCIMARQTVLEQSRKLRLTLFRQEEIKEV
jgi:predicted ester cyclase